MIIIKNSIVHHIFAVSLTNIDDKSPFTRNTAASSSSLQPNMPVSMLPNGTKIDDYDEYISHPATISSKFRITVIN